ncbi:oxygen-independent coproporphyrinogen III oxidase [bacterium]|nr:oxygen-independent coproporphyrinogen III oxidase [candidate division CSSED10-310 bacterium]
MKDRADVVSPLHIPVIYLDKYSCRGPRYTSYPTAPHFKPDFDQEAIKVLWKASNDNPSDNLSLYVHIPFCTSRCLYCGCYTEIHHTDHIHELYIRSIINELQMICTLINTSRKISQMAFGGGSPTSVNYRHLETFLDAIHKYFLFSPESELSIEIDPRSIDCDYLDQLITLGFNRFSFGVQDLDPTVQKNVHRSLDENALSGLINHLHRRGYYAINIDLIYGLPGQTTKTFTHTLKKISDMKPSRIAVFGYAHVPWISPHQKALEKFKIPDANQRTQLFGAAFEQLTANGYHHIGMDHFALSDDDLFIALKNHELTRNFMGYTTQRNLDLIGLGASAISAINGCYTQNIKGVAEYVSSNDSYRWHKALILSDEDLIRRDLILELFCNFHLDIPNFESRHQLNFETHFRKELASLKGFISDDMLRINKHSLSVSPLGRYFIRNICMVFDQYITSETNKTRYSKTL